MLRENIIEKPVLKVALVGNPNSGKSTLFNVLTGLNQKTGNFPGVTVEKKTGSAKIQKGKVSVPVKFIDLPGIYSLSPKSIDEEIAFEVLCNPSNEDYPDVTVIIADASNLKRSLFLATQVIELKKQCILALNMMDLVEKNGLKISIDKLSGRLQIPVLPINARKNEGIDDLKAAISDLTQNADALSGQVTFNSTKVNDIKTQASESVQRYKLINSIVEECISKDELLIKKSYTSKLDKVLTHPVWGYVIFLAILFLLFQSVFALAAYPMEWIEMLFTKISGWGAEYLPEGKVSDLLINGILAGISGIVVFIPQIAFLFAFIAILEDTGYMARVSFIMDKLLRKFGLNGKSVIPLISGIACAVPAIMSTRTIGNWKERIITILVTPLMSCSARLPVYTLLISLVIPSDKTFRIFNMQGVVLMALYLLGFIAALGSAWLMKLILNANERSYFIMEMPVYRTPRWGSIGLTVLDKVKVFLLDAGKIIIIISVILWWLSSYGPPGRLDSIEAKHNSEAIIIYSEEERSALIASEKLENSYAGILGKTIEPVIRPLGFDWKIGIALITSFAAREVFVGTMATIYSVGNTDNELSIREKMQAEVNLRTGEKVYTPAVGLSLMIFYAFAMQCMSTLAVVYRETKSKKWPLIQFFYMGGLAYISSLIVYNLFK